MFEVPGATRGPKNEASLFNEIASLSLQQYTRHNEGICVFLHITLPLIFWSWPGIFQTSKQSFAMGDWGSWEGEREARLGGRLFVHISEVVLVGRYLFHALL